MIFEKDNILYYHSIRQNQYEVFNDLKNNKNFIVCSGPVYKTDPAASLIEPFIKSCEISNYKFDESIIPKGIQQSFNDNRKSYIEKSINQNDINNLLNWSLYAAVLENAYINGVSVGINKLHVDYVLNNTITSRDGYVTTHDFNPHFITNEFSHYIKPSDYLRNVVILDFKAMDVFSMMTLFPSVSKFFEDTNDPYSVISSMCSIERKEAKISFLKWAYGGKISSDIEVKFINNFNEIFECSRKLQHGEFARTVQTVSSIIFRASIASVAKELIFSKHFIPMFTIHDSIILDTSDYGIENIKTVIDKMEQKTFTESGIKYRISLNCGYTYFEAKNSI